MKKVALFLSFSALTLVFQAHAHDGEVHGVELAQTSLQVEPIRAELQFETKIEDDGSSKGSVEYEWKVEEGESAAAPGVEPDEIDFMNTSDDSSVEREMKESGEKGGTEDINIGVGESSLKGGISVATGDVNGLTEEEKQEFLLRVKEHVEVRSAQELENFAKGVLLGDENIESVEIDDGKIEVRYRISAKLFGFIESGIPVRARVESDTESEGAVSVRFPWYRFLFSIPDEVGRDNLETSLGTELSGMVFLGTESGDTQRARVLQTISNVLKTRHDTAKNSVNNIR